MKKIFRERIKAVKAVEESDELIQNDAIIKAAVLFAVLFQV